MISAVLSVDLRGLLVSQRQTQSRELLLHGEDTKIRLVRLKKKKKEKSLVHHHRVRTDTWASLSFFSTSCNSSWRALISASLSLEDGCIASSWPCISSWWIKYTVKLRRTGERAKEKAKGDSQTGTLIKASFSLSRLRRCSVSPHISLSLSRFSSHSSCSLNATCLRSSCSWPVCSLITRESL